MATLIPYLFHNLHSFTVNEEQEGGQHSQYEKLSRIEVKEEESSNAILRGVRNGTPLHKETRSSTSEGIPVVSYGEKKSRKKYGTWDDLSTECLLNAYKDKKLNRDGRSLRDRDWNEIAATINQCNQCGTASVERCRDKVKYLKRRYRSELGEMDSCGSTVSQWPWFEKMEQVCTNLAPPTHVSDKDKAVNASVSSSLNLLKQSKRKRLSTGGKNQKSEYMDKMLEDSSTSLCTLTEERDHLNQAYNEENRNMKKTMSENKRLMRELETQRKGIEQQAMEIKKRDTQLDFESKQLEVLRELNTATQASRMLNTVQETCARTKNMSRWDKVQVQIDTKGLHKELKEKDSELDNELNQKQTFLKKEHRSNHDLQETRKVSIEKVTKEDDEKSIELIDEWGNRGGLECKAFQDMFPPIAPPEYLADLCNDMPSSSADLSSLLPVSDDEIAELEWLTTFVEDCLSAGDISLDDFTNYFKKDDSLQFCTSVSVPSISFSGEETTSLSPDNVVIGHVQSKRTEPANFNQAPALNLVSPTPCRTKVQYLPMANSCLSSESENLAESHPSYTPKVDGKEQKKGKMKKRLPQNHQSVVAVKKCSHCEITKTPEWTQGPMGPGTLCNTCGVRFRSGRLCPEYRLAASPTFVSSLHSSSQKKVLEMMRAKATPD